MNETTNWAWLTTPQVNALADLVGGPKNWCETWPPAKKLVELGYATFKTGRFGETAFAITDAGRAHPAVAQT